MSLVNNSVKNWRNLSTSNTKPDLHNINAHIVQCKSTDIYSNYCLETKIQMEGWIAGQMYERRTDHLGQLSVTICTNWCSLTQEGSIKIGPVTSEGLFFSLYHSLGIFSRQQIGDIFSHFSQRTGFNITCKLSQMETICMKCWVLFSGKNKNNISGCRLLKVLPRMQSINELDMFVCVEVLRPSQPNGIMSSVVSLPKAKKKLLDSQALFFFFSKNRSVQAALYFYFPVRYILGHLGLFGWTKWLWFYWKYLKCKFRPKKNKCSVSDFITNLP